MSEGASMTPRYFCTLFDQNYLLKGVAMLRSLAQQCPGAHVYVLCMDAQTQRILVRLALPHVTCIPLAEVEDEALLAAKKNRGVAEYCWTLSPCLPWYVLQNNAHIDFITYIDSDLLFFSPLQPLFDEIGAQSIAILEHRFTPRLRHLEVNGRFCVQWVSFRRDEEGMACLARWRNQCIEWCYYRLEDGRLGDQKYLDEWPERYRSCHIIQNVGAGVAPWNYAQYRFGQDARGRITVEDTPLIFYHFHQFQILDNGGFDRLSAFYTSECAEPAAIYETYEAALKDTFTEVRAVEPGFSAGMMPAARVVGRRWAQRFVPRGVKNVIKRFVRY
jgi:hypothetical protein